jgi:predicted ATP-grasp superfamily ATP-dependent carboligase
LNKIVNIEMSNILVLDANQRSALAAIRSLGRISGSQIFAADSTTDAVGGSSRFCHKYLQNPSLSDSPSEYIKWLNQAVRKYHIDFIFPMTEKSSQLLLMQDPKSISAQLPFANYATVMSLSHKGKLTKLAQSVDVPCPASRHYNTAAEVDLGTIDIYPVVIKPCLSRIWEKDKWTDTVVQIAYNREQLADLLRSTPWLTSHEFMLQEFIPGFGAGLFALYNKGKPVCFFSHKRIREKPPQGGVSVLSESVALDPLLLDNAKKLLDAAHWHGVAMVEFRVATDGTPYLMEVNTRFWGSLQLAIDAGVDFPKLLFQITCGEKVEPLPPYKIGIRLRWLLGDLDSLYLTLKNSSFSTKDKLLAILRFFAPDFRSTRHEVNRWGDLKPAITELKQYVKALIR